MSEHEEDIILVTGATGFVALHIIQLLQFEGYRVRGTVRNLENESKLRPLKSLYPEARHEVELVEADLTKDDGWVEALKGCKYCIHVASPFPSAMPKNETELIVPALEGTNRVLRACAYSGTVRRIVLTSSVVAVHGESSYESGQVYTEEDWTDLSSSGVDAYTKSKTLAERAAWDFVNSLNPEKNIELATINPGLILGPPISGATCTSLISFKRLMDLSAPMIPHYCVPVCDVRDVALAHLRAMTIPEAANNRHIVISERMWTKDIALILKEEFGKYGYFVPTWIVPNILFYLYGFIDGTAEMLYPHLGNEHIFSNTRMTKVLKVEPRNPKDTLIDTAYSLIECGELRKTRYYKPKK